MRKNTIYILGIALVVLLAGCNNWLSVSPRTEKPTDELFETQKGFSDALTGAYLEMMSDRSYGEYLTMSKIEYLVNFLDAQSGSAEQALSLHKYDDAKAETILGEIYQQQFKVILAANAILDYVDRKKEIFDQVVYEAVKGECLAIRAMCHLDILRLFGPVPTEAGAQPLLPYVETVTKELHGHLSFEEYKTKLLTDFAGAEELLKIHLEGQEFITDDYFKYRTIRMNYYAVKALQARAYLWFGLTAEAYEAAKTVIDAKDVEGNPCFRLGTAADFSSAQYTLPCEQVLGVYRFDLADKYTALFSGEKLYKGTKESTVKNDLYGNTGSDIREMNLWNLLTMPNKSRYYVCRKYQVSTTIVADNDKDKLIPLVRLAEMYLIAAETAPEEQAQGLWKDFLASRNLLEYALPQDATQREMAIVKEYRKEFYAEGVVFYLYKRLNLEKAQWLWAPSSLEVNYVLPLPKTELTH